MKFLIDTCVLSELHKNSNLALRDVFGRFNSEGLFVSVLTIGEILKGIELLPEGKRKQDLRAWLKGVEREYANRMIGIDKETAFIWGKLVAKNKSEGFNIGITDSLIAATALQHGLRVMTRNVKDFEHSGVMVYNPLDKVD